MGPYMMIHSIFKFNFQFQAFWWKNKTGTRNMYVKNENKNKIIK